MGRAAEEIGVERRVNALFEPSHTLEPRSLSDQTPLGGIRCYLSPAVLLDRLRLDPTMMEKKRSLPLHERRLL